MGSDSRGHVVLFTLPGQGHYHPIVQVLYHLNANCPGIIATIVVGSQFAGNLVGLQSNGDFGNIDLRVEEVPGEVPRYEKDPKFPSRPALISEKAISETEALRKRLKAQMGTPDAPTSVIGDMFLPWTKTFADELGVPWYTYFPCSPLWTLLTLEYAKLVKAGLVSRDVTKETDDFLLAKVPGFAANCSAFTSVRTADVAFATESFEFVDFYTRIARSTFEAAGLIQNSAEELDVSSGVVPTIEKLLGPSKLFCIGPSLQLPGFGKVYSHVVTDRVTPWLNSQRKKSVLFVAFGSIGTVPIKDLLELAKGLEASGVPFVWALKTGSAKLSEVLPEGFQERTAGRGLIETGWIAQTLILQHQSIGGFLTHCGWNSLLEGICTGVPLIAWPLSGDQLLNARYIHDIAKVGITVSYFKPEHKYSFDDVTGREISLAIKTLILEDEGQHRRTNVANLQKLATAAVKNGGSSHQRLGTLLGQIYFPNEEPLEIADVLQ